MPNRKRTSENLSNGYFDIPVPLCVHDSMLDIRVLSDARGFVAVCHYYLYQVFFIKCLITIQIIIYTNFKLLIYIIFYYFYEFNLFILIIVNFY